MKQACLCIFAKAPVRGEVKTRLLPVLNEQQACRAHESLMEHCLQQTVSASWQSQLWSTDSTNTYVRQCAEEFLVPVHSQQGEDLGARMANAVQQSLQDFSYVIIIGTDCPDLDTTYINKALYRLKAGDEVVIGPAADGGYVLIALSIEADNIFKDIEWGSTQVLNVTRQHLRESGLKWSELEIQRDIDRPEDLGYMKQEFPELYHSIGVSLSFPQSDHEPG